MNILPRAARMDARRRLMLRLNLTVRQFEARIKNEIMLSLEESVFLFYKLRAKKNLMDSKDLLDDNLDWDTEINSWAEKDADNAAEPTPVTMIQTFGTEQEADLAAAMLRGEGIDGRVVSAITGAMTPFAYGNVRLFVATSQAAEAAVILRKLSGQQAVYDVPETSSTQILLIIIIGIFVMGLILTLVRAVFGFF